MRCVHAQAAELRTAADRLDAALPATGRPRTRALANRARELADGLPIGMTAPDLLQLIHTALPELCSGPTGARDVT